MFEFVAIGPEHDQNWRREITPDRVVRLGRYPESGWEVPWDPRISREHADLVLQGDRLLVRCLESAMNAAHVANTAQREFSIAQGEQFRIGSTVFRLEKVSRPAPPEPSDDYFDGDATAFRAGTTVQRELQALKEELESLRIQSLVTGDPDDAPVGCRDSIGPLLADLQELKDLWESESQTLREANQRLEETNQQLREKIEQLIACQPPTEATDQESDEQIELLLVEMTSLEQRCSELGDALEHERAAHERTQQEFQQRLSDGNQQREQSEAKATEAAAQLKAAQAELSELRKLADTANEQKKAGDEALRRAKEAAKKATEAARREANLVARQLTEINALKGGSDTLKAKLKQAQDAQRREENNSARLQDELESAQSEVESLHVRLTDAEVEMRQAEFNARHAAEEAEQNARESETLRAEVDSLRAEVHAKDAAVRKAELVARHKSEEAIRYLDELKQLRSGASQRRASGSGSGSRTKPKSSASGARSRTGAEVPSLQGSTLSKPHALGSFGQYNLMEQIGQGGMGTVYKAIHTRLERIVALKIVTGGRLQSEEHMARFDREMKAIGRLTHPNLVQAMDAGENKQCLYLVMEFIDGLDVAALVQKVGPLPVADACEIVRQASLGLDYIHRQQLVHRDIKPSNLMITGDEQVKILDLGLALLGDLGDGLTQTGQLMGTLDYMAPEQAGDSHQVDHRADIYSLGCTFYQLLTGKALYCGEHYLTVVKKIMAHAQVEPPSLDDQRPELPMAVSSVLSRMLAKDPEDRPQSLGEVARKLEPFCIGASLANLLIKAGVLEFGHARTTITLHTGVDSTNHGKPDEAEAGETPQSSASKIANEKVEAKD